MCGKHLRLLKWYNCHPLVCLFYNHFVKQTPSLDIYLVHPDFLPQAWLARPPSQGPSRRAQLHRLSFLWVPASLLVCHTNYGFGWSFRKWKSNPLAVFQAWEPSERSNDLVLEIHARRKPGAQPWIVKGKPPETEDSRDSYSVQRVCGPPNTEARNMKKA